MKIGSRVRRHPCGSEFGTVVASGGGFVDVQFDNGHFDTFRESALAEVIEDEQKPGPA